MSSPAPVSVLILLGDFASGVTSWGLRLRDAFSTHTKYRVTLVNCLKTGNRIARFDCEAFTPEDVHQLIASHVPAIVVPNFVFEAYMICAKMAAAGADLRVIGFCRADSEEEYYRPLRFCESAINQFVAVSPECGKRLAEHLTARAGDVSVLPTGVDVPHPLERGYQNAPIRLVYGGRIAQVQKRVMDFVPLVEAMLERNVDFQFDIIGQGRQRAELEAAMGQVPHEGRVRFHKKVRPRDMERIWAEHDVFIQTSDYEGTSNSMLESMAQGTIPVLTRTASGVEGIVRDGENGFLVPVGDMDAMAGVIARLQRTSVPDLALLGRAAHATASDYSIERYVERFTAILDRSLEMPPPAWPSERPLVPDFPLGGVRLAPASPSASETGQIRQELLEGPWAEAPEGPLPAPWKASEDARLLASGTVELVPASENVHVQQMCRVPRFGAQARIEACLEARVNGEEVFGFNCYYEWPSGKKTYGADHPGDGQWHTLSHAFDLREEPGVHRIRFLAVLRKGATEPAQLRAPSLRLITTCESVPDLRPFANAPVPPLQPGQRRLLILFPSPLRGGAEDYCVTIARAAIDAGWQVHAAFTARQATASLIRDFTALGVQYHPLDIVDVGNRSGHAVLHKRFTRTWRLLRKVQPSVGLLELCGLQYGLGPILAFAARGIPVAIVFQMVRSGIRVGVLRRHLRALARKRSQRYVAVSEENRRLVAEAFAMPHEQIVCIPNGADPARFARTPAQRAALRTQLREELGLPEDALLLITVGRLTEQKGHDLLVPAIPHILARHPNARFIWAGEGPAQKRLAAAAAQYGVQENVLFLGRRPDIPDLLNASDLFVHPTRFEGQPFSLLEAMAAGMPIVTTNASAICEVIEHGKHALIGRVDDIRDLRENILYALDHPAEMQAMATHARQRLDAFSEENMTKQTLGLLRGMCR